MSPELCVPRTLPELCRTLSRTPVQRLLRSQIEVLGDELYVLSEEFGDWDDSRRRIAGKVYTPLEANMIIAVEPKKGLEGIGLVGVENTFRVTVEGGERLTLGADEIKIV